jgi:uncharacterized membrane protein YhiD involved in acid resistance
MVGIGVGLGMKLGVALKALFAAGAIIAVVSVLTWERIKMWFQARDKIRRADADNVAFSLVEKLKENKFKTVYGIFNQRTETILGAETVTSDSLDETLRMHHESEPLVVYR